MVIPRLTGRTIISSSVTTLLFLLLSLFLSNTAQATSTEVIYQSDFSSDPEWVTDQPQNFHWDEAREVLYARTENQPQAYAPSRYYYTETSLNPKLSYELSWDIKILSITGGNTSGVAVFGLYGDKLYGFNPLNLNFPGNDQDGTFSLRLMTLDGSSSFIFTELNSGYNNDIGEMEHNNFSLDTWYSCIERYNALTYEYSYEIKNRDSGMVIFTHTIQANPSDPVNPSLNNLGLSMHPEGTGATQLAQAGRASGATEYLIDNVSLTQIYDETYDKPSSVLFLPGIQASRLYTGGLLGSEDRLWEPNINGDVAQLAMTTSGESIEAVYTRDVVDNIFGIYDVYGSFLQYLDALKNQGVISDWSPFSYDWRHSVDDVVLHGTQSEAEVKRVTDLVEQLARNNNSHVTIVAHSNGGLLAKALVSALETERKAYLIDQVILVASPQLGTPKTIGSILHGYEQEHMWGIITDDATARDVMRNMPGAYGLIPSDTYFDHIDYPLIRFENASATQELTTTYGLTIDSPQELADFMSGERDGRDDPGSDVRKPSKVNGPMYEDARILHRDQLDTWAAPPYVKVVEIVGVGLDTVKGFEYKQFYELFCAGTICTKKSMYEPTPLFSQYGDETVMALSAEGYSGEKSQYYIDLDEVDKSDQAKPVAHANITSLPQLQQLIGGLIEETVGPIAFIYTERPAFTEEREAVSVHSPVELELTDMNGYRVGKNIVNGHATIVTDIPGSSYFSVGGSTYILVPKKTNYIAKIKGVGKEGSYTLLVESLTGEGNPVTTLTLSAATVTPEMDASFSKVVGVYSELAVDYNGDGSVDETHQLVSEPGISELFIALHTTVDGFVNLKDKDKKWLHNSLTKAESTGASKGYSSSAVIKIFEQINKRLVQYVTEGIITRGEYNVFVGLENEIKTR